MELKMYCRREPARDGTKGKFDVCLYLTPTAPILCRYPWSATNIPTRRNKFVMYNCYRYRIHWLDHMGKPV